MATLEELLDKIRTANTNISSRLGILNDHITEIVEAGKEILRKIQSGHLKPGEIAQIRDRIEELRAKTMRNINSRNGRIVEIQRIFDELLAISPTAPQMQAQGQPAAQGQPPPVVQPAGQGQPPPVVQPAAQAPVAQTNPSGVEQIGRAHV